jgi:hypothetical protein
MFKEFSAAVGQTISNNTIFLAFLSDGLHWRMYTI